ncbi:helix-turn-helix domain-containing protein [Streptomyces sp. NPDC048629]|uniref:helix-turn-helix transcriptional regulator n=1 Tax=Streptomyces sp. NPDC048629 TaxID=3154824 RepID=UPI003419D1E5
MNDELLTPADVEERYPFTQHTLANWRWSGLGPAYIKTSPARSGRVLYRRSAIEAWLTAQTVTVGSHA